MEQSNTSLYSGLRQKMSINRGNLKESSDKLVDLQANFNLALLQISELQAQMQVIQNRVGELEGNDISQSITSALQNFSDDNVQPLLEELCTDIQSITEDVKILKLNSVQIKTYESDLTDSQSSTSINKTQPKVKPLTLNRNASVTRVRN